MSQPDTYEQLDTHYQSIVKATQDERDALNDVIQKITSELDFNNKANTKLEE